MAVVCERLCPAPPRPPNPMGARRGTPGAFAPPAAPARLLGRRHPSGDAIASLRSSLPSAARRRPRSACARPPLHPTCAVKKPKGDGTGGGGDPDDDFDEDDDGADSMAWEFTRRSVFAALAAGSLGLQLNVWGTDNSEKIEEAAATYFPGLTADPSSPTSFRSRVAVARSPLTGEPLPVRPDASAAAATVDAGLAAALLATPVAAAVTDLGLVSATALAAAEATRRDRARALFPSTLPADDGRLAAAAAAGTDVGAL